MEESLLKSIHHLKSLSTVTHFEHVINRYLNLHNKGIFVDFSYNSLNANDLFGVLFQRYGVTPPENLYVQPKFTRMKKVKIDSIRTRIEQTMKSNSQNYSDFKKIEMQFVDSKGDIQSFLNSSHLATLDIVDTVFKLEKEKFEKEKKSAQSMLQVLRFTVNNTRRVTTATENSELMYFDLILDFYMKQVASYLKELFQNETLYVTYDKQTWREYFRSANNTIHDHELSSFENRIIQTITQNKGSFTVEVKTVDYSYKFSKTSFWKEYIDVTKYQPTRRSTEDIELKLEGLYKKYPDFYLILRASQGFKNTYQTDTDAYHSLNYLLHHVFSKEVIEEYNQLINELNDIKKEHTKTSFPTREPIPTIQDVFPHLVFNIGQQLDWGYKIGLNQEKYNDIILSVSNDTHSLTFEEQIEED